MVGVGRVMVVFGCVLVMCMGERLMKFLRRGGTRATVAVRAVLAVGATDVECVGRPKSNQGSSVGVMGESAEVVV